jgi:hypothetical protein
MIVLDYHRKLAHNDLWVYAPSHSRWQDLYP